MSKCNIVPPYVSDEYFDHYERSGNGIDKVERSGFVSPDKKIESFVQSGSLLQDYRASGEQYELQGGESDFEEDTEEYRDELTKDAENYSGAVLPQFMDNISANERMEELIRNSDDEASSLASKKTKASEKKHEEEQFIGKFADTVAKRIVEETAKTEPNGKEA